MAKPTKCFGKKNEKNQVVALEGIVTDITERKQAETLIKESEEKTTPYHR